MRYKEEQPDEVTDVDAGPAMPAGAAESASAVQGLAGHAAPDPGPPPSMGRQMAQLVIIPAVIAIVAIGLFWIFGSIAATPDSLDDQLRRLKQPSGYGGDLMAGAQDPRYKDRCQAAFQIAAIIERLVTEANDPKLSEPERAKKVQKLRELSDELVVVLEKGVLPHEHDLQHFMVRAIGRLAQPGGFEPIMERAQSPNLQVRAGVLLAIMGWADSDLETARAALPVLVDLLKDPHEQVRTLAAAGLWAIATPDDGHVIAPLKEAMTSIGADPNSRLYQSSVSHAAIALAALGDEQGSTHVVEVLLNREALARQRADMTGKSDATMNTNEQDHFIASVLHYVKKMDDQRIWTRIEELSKSDSSLDIRKAALQLLAQRKK